ncbi:MAG: TIGR02206 family membrane protein [Phycisphaerae bacterium]|nr:TIGR02206 family membrane protein [Phycisphaerae bacterium]
MLFALAERGFTPFSPTHAGAVCAAAVIIALTVGSGLVLRRRDPVREGRLRRFLAALALLVALSSVLFWLTPSRVDLTRSLPLHVCDLASLAAPFALAFALRPARALVYGWGVPLSSQAFLTPIVTNGPTAPEFWIFWAIHTQIITVAIYDLVVAGYRPTRADWRLVTLLGVPYLALAAAVNARLGSNYAFIGRPTPENPTLVDALGPWPVRAVLLALLAQAAVTLAFLPWIIRERRAPIP